MSQATIEHKGYLVEYQTGQYTVSGKNGKVHFDQIPEGLYILDLAPIQRAGIVLVNTIAGNKASYSKRQIAKADCALQLQEIIMFASLQDFKTAIQMNAIKNCPVTIEDVNICHKIYGKHIPTLKGKIVRLMPQATFNNYIKIPKELKLHNQKIELCADLMYIQGIIF